eukprot:Rhum_TRINITY_DN17123_c0_g1::Rhum_TRINITY_DN17123_c0_g1_i1::g.165328::m.165328
MKFLHDCFRSVCDKLGVHKREQHTTVDPAPSESKSSTPHSAHSAHSAHGPAHQHQQQPSPHRAEEAPVDPHQLKHYVEDSRRKRRASIASYSSKESLPGSSPKAQHEEVHGSFAQTEHHDHMPEKYKHLHISK